MNGDRLAVRVYRVLLHLYPHEFRDEYGADMVRLVRDQSADEPAWRVAARAAVDLAITIPAQHLEAHMNRPSNHLVPLLYTALACAGLLFAAVGGSNAAVVAFGLTIAAVAGSRGDAAAPIGGTVSTRGWWKLVLAGPVIIAAVLVAAGPSGSTMDRRHARRPGRLRGHRARSAVGHRPAPRTQFTSDADMTQQRHSVALSVALWGAFDRLRRHRAAPSGTADDARPVSGTTTNPTDGDFCDAMGHLIVLLAPTENSSPDVTRATFAEAPGSGRGRPAYGRTTNRRPSPLPVPPEQFAIDTSHTLTPAIVERRRRRVRTPSFGDE